MNLKLFRPPSKIPKHGFFTQISNYTYPKITILKSQPNMFLKNITIEVANITTFLLKKSWQSEHNFSTTVLCYLAGLGRRAMHLKGLRETGNLSNDFKWWTWCTQAITASCPKLSQYLMVGTAFYSSQPRNFLEQNERCSRGSFFRTKFLFKEGLDF